MKKGSSQVSLFLTACLAICINLNIFAQTETSTNNKDNMNLKNSIEIRKKLGQLLILDFRNWGKNDNGKDVPLTKSNKTVENIISKYNLGGVVLFKENTVNPTQTIKLINSFQKNSEIPLIIGIDQEGGIVTRLQSGTNMPGNMLLGAVRNPKVTEKVAKAIGQELYCQGINMNFAPVIDVNSNPNNPVIGVRSFSSNPELVAKLGKAYIDGLKKSSVLSCVKHFPGHGNTSTDTHIGLAVVNYELSDLEKTDFIPFKTAIDAGVDAIMTAHVIVPSLDDTKIKSKLNGKLIGTPATLSHPILTDVLRKKMKFNGLIITDAMDMKAIADNFGHLDSVIKTILAGADIPLMPVRIWNKENISKLEELVSGMEDEYNNNKIFKVRVDESYDRIMEFKSKNKLESTILKSKDLKKDIANAQKIVGSKANHVLEKMVSGDGITLVKNTNNTLPFKMQEGSNILITDNNNLRLKIAKKEILRLAEYNGINIEVNLLKVNYKNCINKKLEDAINKSNLCIILTYNLNKDELLPELIADLAKKSSIKTVSISCRNPYDISYIPSIDSNICIYGAVGFDQTNYKQSLLNINIISAINTIFMNNKTDKAFINPHGKLPVDIPSNDGKKIIYPFGTGLSYLKN